MGHGAAPSTMARNRDLLNRKSLSIINETLNEKSNMINATYIDQKVGVLVICIYNVYDCFLIGL